MNSLEKFFTIEPSKLSLKANHCCLYAHKSRQKSFGIEASKKPFQDRSQNRDRKVNPLIQ